MPEQDPAVMEEVTLVSLRVQPIPFLESVATQSDWTSRLMRETWFGLHYPWARIMFLVLATSSVYIVGALVVAMNAFPIFELLTSKELENHSTNLDHCLSSLCEVAMDLDLTCVVNEDGKSTRVDFDTYEGSRIVPMTHACQQFVLEAFGLNISSLLDLRPAQETDRYTTTDDDETDVMEALLSFHPLECEFQYKVGDVWAHTISLVEFTELGLPGTRHETVLERWVCVEEMSEDFREVVLPTAQKAKTFLFRYRHAIVATIVGIGSLMMRLGTTMMWMPLLFVTALFLRLNLSWPKEYVGRKQITLWSTWQTLVLLCFLTDENADPLSPICLMLAAMYYRNWTAASEWLFLTILLVNISELDTFWNEGGWQQLALFDGLGILRFCVSTAAIFVPGRGWWKWVSIYAFYRAFPRAPNASAAATTNNTNRRPDVQ